MMDDRLDEQLKELAADYNTPPETPRDTMWMAIQAGRTAKKPATPVGRNRVIWFGLAAAALLALGIFIGRGFQKPGNTNTQTATGQGPDSTDSRPSVSTGRAYHIAAVQYLGETEEFLTSFRADLKQGGVDKAAAERARQLLSANRLLMDSPAGEDPKIKPLLQDLELVLAEISQLTTTKSAREEAGLISEGLEEGGLLPRLRTAVPSGQSPVGL
jgi:hypothetical protein